MICYSANIWFVRYTSSKNGDRVGARASVFNETGRNCPCPRLMTTTQQQHHHHDKRQQRCILIFPTSILLPWGNNITFTTYIDRHYITMNSKKATTTAYNTNTNNTNHTTYNSNNTSTKKTVRDGVASPYNLITDLHCFHCLHC